MNELWFKGPINPDVTALADNTITEDIEIKDNYEFNEAPKEFEKMTNEVLSIIKNYLHFV